MSKAVNNYYIGCNNLHLYLIAGDCHFAVINGEKAAFNTPVFANKRRRTLEMLIRSIYQEHMPENSKVRLSNIS